MAEKRYYSMGEVSELFDVNPSLIRYWCKCFTVLRPKRNAKGNRLFTPEDVENLKLIYHLVKERGMTLEGAQRAIKAQRAAGEDASAADVQLLDRLQRVRAMLVQVRDLVGAGEGVHSVDDDAEEPADRGAAAAESVVAPAEAAVADGAAAEERPLPFYEQTLF